MILCTTQPIEKYSVDHSYGFKVGLGEIYEEKPALFSLLSIASPFFYQWEEGSPVPPGDRCSKLSSWLNDLYNQTLQSDVGGLSVGQWLNLLSTPTELYLNFNQFSLTGLPLLDFYNVDQLRFVMRARCRSWIVSQNKSDLNSLLTLFTEQDEEAVKKNAYGKFYVSTIR